MNPSASSERSQESRHGLCEHLAVCPQCQALLEQLSDDADLRRQAPICWPPEDPAANEPALTHLLQELHGTPSAQDLLA